MYFGKIKNTDDEWGFDVFTSSFESYVTIDDSEHLSIVNQANSEGKLIKGDSDGNPILVNPPEPTDYEKAQQKISELEQFLTETDWYAIRYADTGEEIPAEIKKNRQDAREEISRLREESVVEPEPEPEEAFIDYQIDEE